MPVPIPGAEPPPKDQAIDLSHVEGRLDHLRRIMAAPFQTPKARPSGSLLVSLAIVLAVLAAGVVAVAVITTAGVALIDLASAGR